MKHSIIYTSIFVALLILSSTTVAQTIHGEALHASIQKKTNVTAVDQIGGENPDDSLLSTLQKIVPEGLFQKLTQTTHNSLRFNEVIEQLSISKTEVLHGVEQAGITHTQLRQMVQSLQSFLYESNLSRYVKNIGEPLDIWGLIVWGSYLIGVAIAGVLGGIIGTLLLPGVGTVIGALISIIGAGNPLTQFAVIITSIYLDVWSLPGPLQMISYILLTGIWPVSVIITLLIWFTPL